MSVAEIVEMMAFERLEPFGDLVQQFIGGQIAATVANVNRNPDKTPAPYRADDFMPALRVPEAPSVRGADLTPDQLSDLLDAELFGHTVH